MGKKAWYADETMGPRPFVYVCCLCGNQATVREEHFWCETEGCYVPVDMVEVYSRWERLVQDEDSKD